MSPVCAACRAVISDDTERICANIGISGGPSRNVVIAVMACSTTCLMPAIALGWPTPLTTQIDFTAVADLPVVETEVAS